MTSTDQIFLVCPTHDYEGLGEPLVAYHSREDAERLVAALRAELTAYRAWQHYRSYGLTADAYRLAGRADVAAEWDEAAAAVEPVAEPEATMHEAWDIDIWSGDDYALIPVGLVGREGR